jgi:iron-sulfur cluster insertion protein
LSYQYLMGSQVDFQESLQGSQFVVANPNATATCGCGNSFAV